MNHAQNYTNNCWIQCKSVGLTYLYKGVHIEKNNIVHKGKVHYITFTGRKYHCSQCEELKLLFIYNYSK